MKVMWCKENALLWEKQVVMEYAAMLFFKFVSSL